MGNVSSRTLRKHPRRKEMTVGDLVAAFYDEAQRLTRDPDEAEYIARQSLMQVMNEGQLRGRRG